MVFDFPTCPSAVREDQRLPKTKPVHSVGPADSKKISAFVLERWTPYGFSAQVWPLSCSMQGFNFMVSFLKESEESGQ